MMRTHVEKNSVLLKKTGASKYHKIVVQINSQSQQFWRPIRWFSLKQRDKQRQYVGLEEALFTLQHHEQRKR